MLDVSRTKLSLYLELEGLGRFEVVAYNSSFSLSGIPSASCVLAIGRNAADVSKKAAIHTYGNQLTEMHKAKVYFKAEGKWDSQTDWPSEETIIFDGRLTGIGHRKANGQVQFVAHLIHWVADMAFSSSLSEQSHPSNPTDYTFRANYSTASSTGAKGPAAGIAMLTGVKDIKGDNILQDLWGKALQPFFCKLSTKDTIKVKDDTAGRAVSSQKNDFALAALARFEGDEKSCGVPRSEYTPKLSLNQEAFGGLALRMGRTIAQSVVRDQIESYSHTTLWDTLVGILGPRFMFSVIPLVDHALVVPVIPGLRETYVKEIDTSEYEYLDLSAFIPRPVRGVGIFGQKEMRCGFRDPTNNPNLTSHLGIGGYYTPDPEKKGMLVFKSGPPWLANISTSFTSPARTTGMKDKKPTGGTGVQPESSDGVRGGQDDLTQGEAASAAAKAYNRYAHALYIMETLRGRQGALAGKLRWDISPGSNLKVNGSGEQFVGSDSLGQNLVGTVVRVTHGINADSGRAGTSFQLAHIRTEAENDNDATSIEQHPLYGTKFLGAPLVDAYQFK